MNRISAKDAAVYTAFLFMDSLLTATGIAPDLHRTSLLRNQHGNVVSPNSRQRWETEAEKTNSSFLSGKSRNSRLTKAYGKTETF